MQRQINISIVLPVYNAQKYLKEAIESILNQTYTNFEFIIINDGSTDKSEEIIKSFDDTRIVYIKNEKNLKIVQTLNKGYALAKGKYIVRMDADDIAYLTRLEEQINFMENNLDIGVCGTWLETFGSINEIWKMPTSYDEICASMLLHSPIMHPSVIIRKNIFNDLEDIYKEEYNLAEDYELWVRLIDKVKFANIPKVLLKYRVHPNQTNKHKQTKVANQVRQNLLKKIGCDLDDKEYNIFYDIVKYNYISYYDFKLLLDKIIASNSKNILDNSSIKSIFYNRYWLILNLNTSLGLKVFRDYFISDIDRYITISKFQLFKLLIKSILKYKKEV